MATAFDPKDFAQKFIERAEGVPLRGKKRDDAALEYYVGAATALEKIDPEAAGILRRQAVLIISVRGYIGVRGIAQGVPA